MINLKALLDTHGSKIKYLLLVVLILVMLLAVRTYINYITIIETTNTVEKRTANVQTEMDYTQNFQTRYLASEYGHLFLAHDNNSLFRGESIISFKSWTGTNEQLQATSLTHIPDRRETAEQQKVQMTPQEARQQFIKEKIEI